MPRRMNHKTSDNALRAAIERRREVHFWGSAYRITPRLVSGVLGDGEQLIRVTPLNTRPNYYVIRVDSGWSLSNFDDSDDLLCDHLEEIYDAIAEDFGDRDFDEWLTEREKSWPCLSANSGVSWCEYDWPLYPKKKAMAL